MTKPNLQADKINSPIQLMAAWFVMLILLSGVLLTAADQIEEPDWAAGYLVLFTSFLVIGVLVCVILMLTKFRPNLQEGKEYAEWLKDQNKYSEGFVAEEIEGKVFARVQKKFEELKASAAGSDQLGEIERIEDSVLYHVSLSDLDGAEDLMRRLDNLGVSSDIYELSIGSKFKDSEAIWLGSNIPPSVAIPIIREAVTMWPHLKYVSLSEDSNGPEEMHWQVYLGGATETAVKERLRPWTTDELLSINATTREELHSAVRRKYP